MSGHDAGGSPLRIALIGFGEVGQVLAAGLAARNDAIELRVHDIAFDDASSVASRAAARLGLTPHRMAADALADATTVLCAVTAAADLDAARQAAPHIHPGAFYLDMNSASPALKRQADECLSAAGARYVEAAVMSPIEPRHLAAPMLLGGPHAEAFAQFAATLGFESLTVFSDTVGPASATKMCRSVIIKGMEALLAESLLAARHYGVEREVIASLSNLLPAEDWSALARYLISRSIEHGTRRAEEMREVALTVSDAGIEPLMSLACVERQQWATAFGPALAQPQLEPFLDAMRRVLAETGAGAGR